jgi:asparagine synthase (glutamine-hydrolysing)
LSHRGPDEANTWAHERFGLAHTRLAIIDRAHGAQPIQSLDGRYVLVFNGEIYNHHELRQELITRGYPIRTRCDSEVLPYLYDAEGPSMVERLRGMFAFAILDIEAEELFLARDRLGKKPLYFASTPLGVSFASTLDALEPLLPSRPSLNPQAIAEYLMLQYVPSGMSPWCGVEKVEPGTWIRWRSGSTEHHRYWAPPIPKDSTLTDHENARSLRDRIREAVAVRLESEVPVGVFLSGGLDSSVVVAEMRALGVKPRTFSVGFEQEGFDERSFADMVARRFDTEHQTLIPEMDVQELFRRFTTAYDEPFADSSALATLAVAEAASHHVTVVLTGDGGDELFGGYDRYRVHRVAERAASIPTVVRRSGAAVGASAAHVTHSHRLAGAARFVSSDPWEAYRRRMFHFQPTDALAMLSEHVRDSVDILAPVRRFDGLREIGSSDGGRLWVPWVDAQTYLPDDLLTKMDRATMAFGVEARSPFLDQELWRYVSGFPRTSLVGLRRGKLILREAYREVLPAAVLRRSKKGFGVPIASWMRTHLRGAVCDLLMRADEPVGGLLDAAAVRRLTSEFLGGADEHQVRIWNLLALSGWFHARSGAKG